MTEIIDNLRMFNRKERFFLVGMALGNPDFKLCRGFRQSIGQTFALDIPEDAFAAMDYHLDWIYASLFLSFNENPSGMYANTESMIQATQEDIDFLVAYKDIDACHIIMLEAKGVMNFTNRQLLSKVRRLSDIFGANGKKWEGVIPHFAIISPQKPERIDSRSWPAWLKRDGEVTWIEMPIPDNLQRITRCDESGRPSISGTFWKVAGSHTSAREG